MTIERINDLYNSQPFQPFVLHLADGRNIAVQSREFIAQAPNGRTLVVFQPNDRMHIIDLLLVTDAEVKLGRNGSRRRRN